MATEKELAQLALHVYDIQGGSAQNRPRLPAGWVPVVGPVPDRLDGFSVDMIFDKDSKAALLRRTHSGQNYLDDIHTETRTYRPADGLSTYPLKPGMQIHAEVDQGHRTVMEYLLSPVSMAVHEAGRER